MAVGAKEANSGTYVMDLRNGLFWNLGEADASEYGEKDDTGPCGEAIGDLTAIIVEDEVM